MLKKLHALCKQAKLTSDYRVKESDSNDQNASDKTEDDDVEHDAISETHKEYNLEVI